MKIVITITSAEISELIQQHLVKEGMHVNIEDIKYSKGSAVVTADAPMEIKPDAPPPVEETTNTVEHGSVRTLTPRTPELPMLTPIDGGTASTDMSDVFRASQKLVATNEGKFPVPKHSMLDGESSEFPYPEK